MPAPFTIVTFTDADGDEFPVRIAGHWEGRKPELRVAAKMELDRLIESGDFNPTMPVTITKVEAV